MASSYLSPKRNIVTDILLTIVTCGIYGIFWFYRMCDDVGKHVPKAGINPVLDVILSLVTCGIYGIYAAYRNANLLKENELEENMTPPQDVVVICLVLAIFCPIAAYAIFQDSLNKHMEKHATRQENDIKSE